MNIDSITIKVSWRNLKDMIRENVPQMPVRDLDIRYDGGIVLSGSYLMKIDIPFSITISRIAMKDDNVELHIKDISAYIKLPGIVKDILIKNILKGFTNKISYEDGILVVKGTLLKELILLDEFKVISLSGLRDYLQVELGGLKFQTATMTDDLEVIEYNEDIKIEEFNEDKVWAYNEKLRDRIIRYTKGKVPGRFQPAVPYLRLLPDMLILFMRLVKDIKVSKKDKAVASAGISYIFSPMDIIPDYILPFGLIDDLVIAFYVMEKLLLNIPEEVINENFSGSVDIPEFVRRNSVYVKKMLPPDKYDKAIILINNIIIKAEKSRG